MNSVWQRLRLRARNVQRFYKAYSFFYRLSMAFEWFSDPRNARIPKLVMKSLVLGFIGLLGFILRDLLHLIREQYGGYQALLESVATFLIPDTWAPYLASEEALIGVGLLSFIILGAVICIIWGLSLSLKRSKIIGFSDENLRKPTPAVQQALLKFGEAGGDYFAVGGVIEIGRHPFLLTDPSISGWDAANTTDPEIIIEHDFGSEAKFDAQLIAQLSDPTGYNGRKYALVATPVDYIDASPKLCLQVRHTSYYEIDKYLRLLKTRPELKGELTSINPEDHQIPNSLCLHYIVQLADGNILCFMKKKNTRYSGGTVGFTGEEQLSASDLGSGGRLAMNNWFKRSLCEEIFPLRTDADGGLEASWKKVEQYVSAMRIFSIIYEEDCANFALVGFARLNLDLHSFKIKYTSLATGSLSGRDKEGSFFVLSKKEAVRYFQEGECALWPVWGECVELVSEKSEQNQLHPSARYRLLMLLSCTGALTAGKCSQQGVPKFDYSVNSIQRERIAELEAELTELRKNGNRDAGS